MAQIKIAEYTFDNSVGDCLPTLRLSSIQMTTEDIISGVITKRTVYIDDATLPYQLHFLNQTALLTVDYLHIGSNITNLASLFSGCTNLKTVNATNWDLSSCTNISFMFQGCSSLTKLDLRNWVTNSATTMQGMFHSCSSLTEIKGIENFNVSKVTSFGSMFYLCKSLTKLDLRNWVTSSATTFQDMFASCSNLEVIRVDNFDTSKVTNTGLNAMFSDCKKVKTLNLNSFVNAGLGNFLNFCYKCESLEYISAQNFIWGNFNSAQGLFTNCKSLKYLDFTTFDGSNITTATVSLRLGNSLEGVTCPIYYNSNTCTANDTALTGLSNAIDVQGRLMAVYDFSNEVTSADVYPTLTGSTVTKTIDTQGSESHITHRVIGVDVMPTEIKFGGIVTGLLNVDYLAVTSSCTQLSGLFDGCVHLESINTFGWDTSNVQGQNNRMFTDCSQLTELDMTWFNTSKITMMRDMFSGCSKLTELDLSSFNTENVTSFQSMFWECTNLVTLNVSSFNTEKCTHFPYMFWGCTSLQELDLTNFNTTKNTMGDSIFNLMTSNQIVYVHDTNWTLDESPATVVRLRDKIIARYTFDNSISNCLPTFNDTMPTTEHLVSDVVNGTITKRIISTNGDLPRKILFSHDYYSDGRSILTCDYLDTSNCNTLVFLFYACNRLTYVNTSSWDTSKVTDFSNSFSGASAITELDTANIDTSSATTLGRMFYNCSSLKSLDLSSWNVSKVTSFDYMFRGCSQLTSLDISAWNTGSGTTFIDMFNGLTMTELDVSHFDMSKATNITGMFGGTRISTMDLSSWNLLNVTNMSWLFSGSRIQNVNLSGVNIPNVTNAEQMFSSTPYLQSVDFTDAVWNINSTVSMGSAFNKSSIQSLVLPAMKPSNLSGTWSECTSLTTIDVSKLIMSDCNNLTSTFNQCNKLTEIIGINKWDTSEVTTLYGTFTNCTSITELDLSGWDTRKVTDTHNMLMNWTNNQTIYYEPPYWSIGTTTLNSNINWVVNITRNNGYWLDMSAITGDTTITLFNENNLATEEILTDWGDGTQNSELTHTYSTAGEYVVVSNLQNAKSSGNLKDYITKMVVYYASTPGNMCFNYNKITEVTLTNNWAEKTIEKYGQKVSTTQMFRNCPLLELPNLELVKQFKPTYCVGMFYNCQKFTSMDLTGWDLSNCTSMELMFSGCTSLTEIRGIESLNVSKCTSFDSLFLNCSSLTSLDISSWDISSATNVGGMFNSCGNLIELKLMKSELNNITNVGSMFRKCSSLTSIDLSSLNLSKATTTQYMFMDCTSLTDIRFNDLSFSNISNCADMFSNCMALTNIDLSSIHITKNIKMNHMFSNCPKLQSIKMFNCDGNVETIHYAFNGCKVLKTLDLSNLTIAPNTSVAGMFWSCKELEMIDLSNIRDIGDSGGVFTECPKLTTLGLLYSTSNTINTLASKMSNTEQKTIYYYDADPSQLTPVEGVKFKKYQNPTTIQLPPHIQLHSLPDGTRDEVDIKTGILTHNTGECTWDDSTVGWGVSVGEGSTTFYHLGDWGEPNYGTIQQDMELPLEINGNNTIVISPNVIGVEVWGNAEARKMNIHVPMKFNNENEAKQWLKENQVTFIYRKETPTTEKLILNYNHSCDYGRILPTGMCDKYDVVNSMYTQTMASILLDGENTWDAMEEFENTVKFTATGTTVGVENLNMLGAGGLYCDNDLFPNINDDSDVEHCRVDEAGNKFYIYISKDRLMSPDLIGYQIWLQANPFNLIYELAEHLTYVKQYEELDPTQARWEGMDCMRDGTIKYHANNSDNITIYPTLEYVAPSINNFEVTMLEPNTDYTIYAEGINTNDTINLGGNDISFNNGTVYTSGDNQWLRIDNNDSFYNMVITKGDTTGEVVPYFEGMTSVENPRVLSGCEGGNLINPDTCLINYSLNTKDGTVSSGSYMGRYFTTDFIEVKEGATYFKGTSAGELVFYDSNKNYVSNCTTSSFTIPSGVKYIRTMGVISGLGVNQYVLKGDDTGYKPFKQSKVSYTDLKLRSLPNGVKDTINVVTGEYIQRVGEIVFDGSEDWVRSAHTNSMMFYTSLNNLVHKEDYLNSISCDKFVVYADEGTLHDSISLNGISGYVDWVDTYPNENWLYIKHADSESSVEKFKQWLKENPVTVQYELAEPIITKLDPQTLLAYTDGTINLSSDTGLLPTTHYTVPSTNTFHLPSMKTGTRYTLKYPSASGSITIGDINYSISSNSMLFTTPLKINGDTSAIIFSDTNPENVVLLEGAYNTREVPYFTGVKSVKNPNITIIDQLSTESTTYNCETEIELRGLPNGVADKLDIIKGKLTTNVGIRPYQEGDENLSNIWTDGYETVYALSSPVVTNVTIDHPTVTTNSLIELSSDYLIPQLNYRAPSSNNFPLDLLQSNTTYTLYADTLVSGSYTLGGTKTGIYSQPHTITLGDMTDNLLTFNGDLGLSNVMLVKGNSLKTTLPPYFLGIRSVTDGHLLVEGMAGEMNEITFDEGIVLRDCNGVKDTIDLITCTLTKRTGEITLTGAEGWYRADNESTTDHNVFKLTLGGLKEALVMCDTLQSVFDTKMMDCIHAHTNELCIVIANATIGGDTVNALKSWLNQHPTTVVYQLSTPIEVQLENTWTTTPPTSYDNQTEISSTVSTNSLKPMISVTVATTTLEEIVSNLETQNAQLEEENVATMLALTSVYETMVAPSVATTSVEPEPQATTYSMRRSVSSAEPVGMSVSPMGMVYARLVSKGFKSIDEVPYNLQPEVMYALRGME